uniref:Uncharacterized protein n=1 Tax=Strongyloides stercoralis TaxID=6248 RepID=A0A0K0EFW7_STRER
MLSCNKSVTNYNEAKFPFYQDKDLYLDLLKLRITESKGTIDKKSKITPFQSNALCRAPVRPSLRRSRINNQIGLIKSRCLFPLSEIIPATPGDDGNAAEKK